MKREVRVRFAPSPTGGLHIGGLRTALFNYLFAKHHNGKFILRIEDTDQSRFVPGAEEYVQRSLEWAGIIPDESPIHGGQYVPYRQSEREDKYLKYAQELLDKGLAYFAFDTPAELEEMRSKLKDAGLVNLNYNSASRMTMKNSLTLSEDEVNARIEAGDPYVVRIKVPAQDEIRLKDNIRGWVHVHSSALDDKVILKSDGLPTYHLANVVDDYLMEITHVIRGEEWLPSAPLHVLLYRYLGWENEMPEFAHLPLILKPDGNGKLSKRVADKAGFPIFPLTWIDPVTDQTSIGFRESGYLPDALVNFLSLLGWNPGTDREIFSMEDLIGSFTLDRIGKAGTKFDIEKAKWFNQQYLNSKSNQELGEYLKNELNTKYDIECELATAESISAQLKTRVTFLHELVDSSLIFFEKPGEYDQKIIRKRWNAESETALKTFAQNLSGKEFSTSEEIKDDFQNTMNALGINPGKVMQILRLALTGEGSGPDLMEIIRILGSEESNNRIINATKAFNQIKRADQDEEKKEDQ